MNAPVSLKRKKRIAPIIISYIFLLSALFYCFAFYAIFVQLNGYTPSPDQTGSEPLVVGIFSVILMFYCWVADIFSALVSLVLGLVSIPSDIRAVKILAIASSALSVLLGVFPIIFAHLNP